MTDELDLNDKIEGILEKYHEKFCEIEYGVKVLNLVNPVCTCFCDRLKPAIREMIDEADRDSAIIINELKKRLDIEIKFGEVLVDKMEV